MKVTSRTSRRYITPTMKDTSRTISSTNVKPCNIPYISHSSPKKILDISTTKLNEALTLKNSIDCFHHDEFQVQSENNSINSDFSWLHNTKLSLNLDESKTTSCLHGNLSESIEMLPSIDIDRDLNKRASLLLNQTFSAYSSDTGHISNIDNDSTRTTINTRIVEYKIGNGEDDILYQWRLCRRLEQASNNEPINFSSKVSNQANISSVRSIIPSKPIEIPTITPSPIVLPSSPITNHESIITPVPIRQYSEASTQTIQDACIQTSLTLSTIPSISNEIDLLPTHDDDDDDDQHLSVCHRPPIRSKCEITQISSSPLSIKRHHRTFRPVVLVEHNSLNTIQSSQESTLTQVTSIMINDNNNMIAINEIQDDGEVDDDILNILKQKRNELLIQFREIERCLANMIS